MTPLHQLCDPVQYRCCDWDFADDAEARRYWYDHFMRHLTLLRDFIRREYPDAGPDRLHAFEQAYRQRYASLLVPGGPRRVATHAPLDIFTLDLWRGELLAEHGFADPWRHLRQAGNAAALRQLPDRLAWLDRLDESRCVEALARGLLAGNLFDLGACAAVERFRQTGGAFEQILQAVPPRRWFRDSLDAWRRRWLEAGGWRHVAFFVDNAGVDIVLGVLPTVRWMAARSAHVTLLANSRPALNDITADELRDLLEQAARLDPPLRTQLHAGRIRVVATGDATPLIDLARLDAACVAAIEDADLIVLEGMGRAIESNRQVRLSCDALRVAMLKDPAVAAHVGGRLFDAYFELTPAGGRMSDDE